MYLVTEVLFAWWAMEGASCGCRGRTSKRLVVKMGAGRGESAVAVAGVGIAGLACAETCASMAAGCAGVGWAAIVQCVRQQNLA